MNFVDTAVRWRHGTLALFSLLTIFGLIAMFGLPLELQPGGDTPIITITTAYPGAGPTEVEDLITRPIEDGLEEVEGIDDLTSNSRSGLSTITVEFDWNVDIRLKLIEVLNKISQVPDLPNEATEPDVQVANGGGASAVMWVVVAPVGDAVADSDHYRDLVEEEVVPQLRRVQGTSRYIVAGGREREVEVVLDPDKLVSRGLRISDVTEALRRQNRDSRGGPLVVGRREYRVSTKARAKTLDQLSDFVVRRDEQGSVLLSDIATIQEGRQHKSSFFLYNGNPAAAIGIFRQNGANVPDLSANLKETLRKIEQELQNRGEPLYLRVAYDEADYISQSVSLVRQNLFVGGCLATGVLLLFLGSLRTVGVCGVCIPTTVVVVFLFLFFFGQTLNILTLAGLAFAVGMVIDNAIVVVENVFAKLEAGVEPMTAAITGTKEVGGALLASTLTTVAVFTPLVLVEGEAGRVFRALGITLASAVAFSLFSALTLAPMLAGLLLRRKDAHPDGQAPGWSGRVARWSLWFAQYQKIVVDFLQNTAEWSLGKARSGRRWTVLGCCASLLLISYLLLPPADYLPSGNRNLIFWLMEPYPGTSVPEGEKITVPPREFLRTLEKVGDYFLIYGGAFRGIGVKLKPELASGGNIQEVKSKLIPAGFGFPGFRFMFPIQIPIFRDPGKEFQVRLTGPDLQTLSRLEQSLQGQIRGVPGVENVRSDFVFGAPELQVFPRRERLAELGMSPEDVAATVEAALGGRFSSEFVDGKETLDISVELKDVNVESPEDLRNLHLVAPDGSRVQLGDVAEVLDVTGPDVVNHVNLERSITMTVSLARTAPLGDTVSRVEKQILTRQRDSLPQGYRAFISGSADQLSSTLSQLFSVFIFSLLITYLLLMALYRSFIYPLVIMMTVPLGLTGGVICLVAAIWTPGINVALDMITAIGFVILTGIVVNNAILLLDRCLQLQREGMAFYEAVAQATRDRLRPILMSAATSVLGMLPLAVIPGEGAELYQGLGIVLVGGLTFSTILTPTVVPALMGLLDDFGMAELEESAT